MPADEDVSRSAGQTHISQLGTQRHSELQQPRTPALQLGMDINTVMIVDWNAIKPLFPLHDTFGRFGIDKVEFADCILLECQQSFNLFIFCKCLSPLNSDFVIENRFCLMYDLFMTTGGCQH